MKDVTDDPAVMEEACRMFEIFSVKLFEQRVISAYREKVSLEKQMLLLEEEEEEHRKRDEQESAVRGKKGSKNQKFFFGSRDGAPLADTLFRVNNSGKRKKSDQKKTVSIVDILASREKSQAEAEAEAELEEEDPQRMTEADVLVLSEVKQLTYLPNDEGQEAVVVDDCAAVAMVLNEQSLADVGSSCEQVEVGTHLSDDQIPVDVPSPGSSDSKTNGLSERQPEADAQASGDERSEEDQLQVVPELQPAFLAETAPHTGKEVPSSFAAWQTSRQQSGSLTGAVGEFPYDQPSQMNYGYGLSSWTNGTHFVSGEFEETGLRTLSLRELNGDYHLAGLDPGSSASLKIELSFLTSV